MTTETTDWNQPIPLVILDEFLVKQELDRLLEYTLSRGQEFQSTGVLDQVGAASVDLAYRRSRVIFDLGGFHRLFADRVMTFLSYVVRRLRLASFPVSDLEIQLTATNHAEFFRAHTDNRSDAVSTRVLTFVYYFHREPQSFSGGELRVYGCRGHEHERPYRVAYPLQNQIVFFPSGCLHEVLPVECPSGSFADSRFTVNGWLHG